jgi:hypothetical protein
LYRKDLCLLSTFSSVEVQCYFLVPTITSNSQRYVFNAMVLTNSSGLRNLQILRFREPNRLRYFKLKYYINSFYTKENIRGLARGGTEDVSSATSREGDWGGGGTSPSPSIPRREPSVE